MKQCTLCAQNFCNTCWLARGSDGTHILNSGDHGYVATEARATPKATRPRSLNLLKPKKEKASVMKTPSPHLGGRNKRTRRRTLVIEESESEEEGLNNDQMDSDEDDDEIGEIALETPRKVSAVRRGKQRRVPRVPPIEEHTYHGHEKASISRDRALSGVVYPGIDTILQEADAANSLLALAGSHGNQAGNITSENTRTNNTLPTLPRIGLTSFGNGSRCETIHNSMPLNSFNSQNFANQLSMDPDMQHDAWYNVSANGTDLPVSMQAHPYPMNPEVTSRIIGHDSQVSDFPSNCSF